MLPYMAYMDPRGIYIYIHNYTKIKRIVSLSSHPSPVILGLYRRPLHGALRDVGFQPARAEATAVGSLVDAVQYKT